MLLLLLACAPATPEWTPLDLVPLVDSFIGTGGAGFGYGGLSPAATVPGGFVKVGPDTGTETTAAGFQHSAGYNYPDTFIRAFSHTRLPGIGVGDGGGLGFMMVDTETVDPARYQSPFSHDEERAIPGYYEVFLPDRGLVKLTATAHAAQHRLQWVCDEHWLTVDLGHTGSGDVDVSGGWLLIDREARELRGHLQLHGGLTGRGRGQNIYFVVVFSQPWQEANLWLDGAPVEGQGPISGVRPAATLRFTSNTEVRVGLSPVDVTGARRNLEAELPGWDFDGVVADAEDQWRERLSKIQVMGGSEEEQVIFASAMYHLFQLPTLYTDVDGRYRGLDGAVDYAADWDYYTDMSLWDSYRTLHPLMDLAWPELAADYAHSLTDMGRKIGYLPRWPAAEVESGSMVGTPADIVLGGSALKGVTNFPTDEAYAMAVARATDPGSAYAREGLSDYQTLGYLPADRYGDSVAKTLEYAIADASLAGWARARGDVQIANQLQSQSQAYRNVFDPETLFMRARNADGSWGELEVDGWGDAFAEGNAWQYSFMVPQDPEGLAEVAGGADALLGKLEEMFERSDVEPDSVAPDPYYWHGNEPALNAVFMFQALGDAERGDQWLRWVREEKYSATPEGLDGNDDGGTLSAWYVWSAIGLYPLNGTDLYTVSSPIFDEVRVLRDDGTLRILSDGQTPGDATLDGVAIEGWVLPQTSLVGGRTLSIQR